MPSNTIEANALFQESFNHHGPFVIRFPRETIIKSTASYSFEYGKWRKELTGKDKVLISLGPIINNLKDALIKNNINATLYNAIYISPMDEEALKDIMTYKKVVIYDPYSSDNGLTESISSYLINHGYKGEVISKAVPNVFVKQGSIKEQRARYKLNVEDIISL